MSIANFLYSIPDIYLLIILSIFMILLCIISIHFIRKFIPIDLRYRDNAMLGSMSGIISIIYGVLVGLTALYLINNISTTAEAVQHEANAAADFYRDTAWLQDPLRTDIRNEIKNYLVLSIHTEWPRMTDGEFIDFKGEKIIKNMTNQLYQYNHSNQTDVVVLRDMLNDIKSLYDARELRIQMSYTTLNPAIWAVVLIGTFLMIFICCLYSMNYYLHIITTCAVSLMTSSMIYLLISLDRPFQGEFSVDPTPLQQVLAELD